MENIRDILNTQSIHSGKSGVLSERNELIKFFVEHLRDKNNKPYKPARIGMLLAHIPTEDLYFFVSICRDVLNRNGNVAMNKRFWWELKTNR